MNLLPTVAATALLAVVPFGTASTGGPAASAGPRDDHGHHAVRHNAGHTEPGDDHGRHTEPGDDHGRHGGVDDRGHDD